MSTLLLAPLAYAQVTQTEIQKLLADDAETADRLGKSVAIDGNTAVIDADGKDGYAGAAYVFTRSGGTWTQQAKLIASDRDDGDRFGWSVAVDGDTAVIGAYGKRCAYVFVRSAGSWTQQAKLQASSRQFGFSVAIDRDTAVIGAHNDGDGGIKNAGAAYVFIRSAGAWTQQAKLLANDRDFGDELGFSVSIDDNTAVIGA